MKVLFLLLPLLLAHCATSSTPKGEALPVLASPARSSDWGSPAMIDTPNGYHLVYQNPDNSQERVTIKGSRDLLYGLSYPPDIKGVEFVDGKMVTTKTSQKWQKAQIQGEDIYFYQSHFPTEGQGPRYKTLGEELVAPNGVIGYYAVDLEGSNSQVRRWLSELRFKSR
ncbi:hypothetical protein V2O64_02810 [Verrucomicrobiaceae bacterium 227]